MTQILHVLADEHDRIRRMLDLFDAELSIFGEAEVPDYEILEGSIAYCRAYLDVYHHPKEDILLEHLRSRDPAAGNASAGLRDQHSHLAETTKSIAAVFDAIREGGEYRRDALVASAHELSAAYRAHLEWEECNFFPLLERRFSAADWAAVGKHFDDAAPPRAASSLEDQFRVLFKPVTQPERPYS